MFSWTEGVNSDRGKLDTEIVYLDENYNFVVQTVSIWIHFGDQKIDTMFRFRIQILDLDSISIIWTLRWFQMKKFELQSCRS
jgi:hypothetical protein